MRLMDIIITCVRNADVDQMEFMYYMEHENELNDENWIIFKNGFISQ